jgi:hypothetical protein
MNKPQQNVHKFQMQIPEWIQEQLKMYGLAATATGVGVLALAVPADARVIYTPANQSISGNGQILVDLDNDGTPEVNLYGQFFEACTTFGCTLGTSMFVFPAQGDFLWQAGGAVSALPERILIGNNQAGFGGGGHFAHFGHFCHTTGNCGGTYVFGNWVNVTNRYLGVKFLINGAIHYGWARFTVSTSSNTALSATLTGYAYETVPNKPILIAGLGVTQSSRVAPSEAANPAPASLGLLATGASGLKHWRKATVPSK